jgi:DNA-binding NtrC family response regulator
MITKPLILICDDDPEVLKTLHLSLRSSFEIKTANSVLKAKRLTEENDFDAAIIDLNFEGQELDGINLLDFMSKKSPGTFLIVLSGDTTTLRIIAATRRKLFEFIVKDGKYFDSLLRTLTRATQIRLANREQAQKKFLTQSKEIKEILQRIDLILKSNTDAPILILGESGTGKEFLAQHVAMNLKMTALTQNMGSIPKDMAESILFGHEKGSFTGAITNKTGLFEAAHGGVLFLDEIGDTLLDIQTKLLRALDQKEIQPLGSNKTKKINVRIIAATHKDLLKQVQDGTFRLDLYQRLSTFIFRLPSLRDRPEDILYYANLFVEELTENGARFTITPDGEQELLSYRWPGNVRELRSVIERIIVLSPKLIIDKKTVAEAILLGYAPSEIQISKVGVVKNNARREELIKALTEYNGNKAMAAITLGVSEATVYRWLQEFDLTKALSVEAFRKRPELFCD